LDKLIQQMLAINPEARPANVEIIIERLDAILNYSPAANLDIIEAEASLAAQDGMMCMKQVDGLLDEKPKPSYLTESYHIVPTDPRWQELDTW
jgi:hypothetical protein